MKLFVVFSALLSLPLALVAGEGHQVRSTDFALFKQACDKQLRVYGNQKDLLIEEVVCQDAVTKWEANSSVTSTVPNDKTVWASLKANKATINEKMSKNFEKTASNVHCPVFHELQSKLVLNLDDVTCADIQSFDTLFAFCDAKLQEARNDEDFADVIKPNPTGRTTSLCKDPCDDDDDDDNDNRPDQRRKCKRPTQRR